MRQRGTEETQELRSWLQSNCDDALGAKAIAALLKNVANVTELLHMSAPQLNRLKGLMYPGGVGERNALDIAIQRHLAQAGRTALRQQMQMQQQLDLRVRVQIIRPARAHSVGEYQSCMFENVGLTRAGKHRRDLAAGGGAAAAGNARIKNVGKSQSCMVYKSRGSRWRSCSSSWPVRSGPWPCRRRRRRRSSRRHKWRRKRSCSV